MHLPGNSTHQHNPLEQGASSRSLHSDNLFSAYKTIKQQQEHLINIRNRINKLQQHQLKTIQKCQNQQKILLSLEQIRQKKSQETKKIQLHKQMLRNSLEQQYHKNHIEKQQHKKSVQSVFTEIKNRRLSNYEFMKKKKQQNQIKLIKIKQLDLEDKKKLRSKVIEDEKKMKQQKMKKKKAKKENIDKLNEKQMKELAEKSKQQDLQIQKMAQLEIQLLQKLSESQVNRSQTKEKYDSYINSHKQALKELRKKQSVESVYVHPLVKRIEKRMDKYNIRNAR